MGAIVAESAPSRKTARLDSVSLLWRAERVLGARIVDAVVEAGHDIRPRYSVVFAQLAIAPARVTDLARVAGMSPQGMTELVDEMERRHFTRREPDPSDRRAKLIVLTDAGESAARVGGAAITSIEASLDALLGRAGHRELRSALEQVIAAQPGRAAVLP